MILVNPKNHDESIEINISEEKALEILKTKLPDNPFARDLAAKFPRLSPAQRYWFFKLAIDNQELEPVQLESNLQDFCKKFGLLQFKVGKIDISDNPVLTKIKELGKVKFVTDTSLDCIVVYSGLYPCGNIIGDKFHPKKKCPHVLTAQVVAFSINPVAFLELFGKATGHCCICGRLLTNEGSVERGIGPICAERYDV